jgi:hypothetical protein
LRGNVRFARIAGAVTLGGAFYTATYITSYPGGAPAFAVFCLLAGTAAGVLALVLPRSPAALTVASVLLGVGFLGAVIRSGIAFGPGLVLMIMAAVRVSRGDPFAFLEESRTERATVSTPSGRNQQGGFSTAALPADREPMVVLSEPEPMVVLPDAEQQEAPAPAVSSDGTVQAGPPGVIGILRPQPRPESTRRTSDGAGFR